MPEVGGRSVVDKLQAAIRAQQKVTDAARAAAGEAKPPPAPSSPAKPEPQPDGGKP